MNHQFTKQALLLLACTYFLSPLTQGEVTLDGSVGPAGALTGPDYQITENLGKRAGSNLFHSFGRFNINSSESATFSGSTGIKNVISRVTGGQASNIDGTLRVSIPNANLYLLNPAGVIFGEHAKLDVPGSFHVSTAGYLKFQDGVHFNTGAATAPQVLTTAEPEAFGFLNNNPASISLSGNTGSVLKVNPGSTISFIGGDITSKNTAIYAPGGRINIASAGSAGEISFNEAGIQTASLGFMAMGDIHISQDPLVPRTSPGPKFTIANIDASNDAAGKIFIRGGQLVMDNSLIASDTTNGNGGGINIELTDDLNISTPEKSLGELPTRSAITSTSYGDGDAGNIAINTHVLVVRGETLIDSSTRRNGNGGDLNINTDILKVFDGGKIVNAVGPAATGNGGNLKIDANSISLTGKDTLISTKVFGSSNGGDLLINTDTLEVRDEASIDGTVFSNGDGGEVTINANHLKVINGGKIITKVEIEATGKGGNLKIDADNIFLSGERALISADVLGHSDGGDLTINVINLKMLDSGRIVNAVGTAATGNGGNLNIDADNIILSGKHTFISTEVLGHSNGGNLTVKALNLIVQNGALIDSSNSGSGSSGNLVVDAKSIALSGNITGILNEALGTSTGKLGKVSVTADDLKIQNGASITTRTFGAANSGDMSIIADEIEMHSNADITASTKGSGNAGNITINANNIALSGKGTGISSEAQPSNIKGSASGSAGDIAISVGHMDIRDGASLSTSDFDISSNANEGKSGNIVLSLNDTLRLENRGIISTQTKKVNAGNITINNGNILQLHDSSITTSVLDDKGAGGNISITTPIVALDNSEIIARATKGKGGNISISGFLFQSPSSIVSASSELGIDGEINLKPDTNISGNISVLPDTFLNVSLQMSERCVARSGNNLSSFVVKGRGGVPLSPGNLAPSNFMDSLQNEDNSLQDKANDSSLDSNKSSSHSGLEKKLLFASSSFDCTQ